MAMMAAHAKFTMNGSPSATWPTASTTAACAGAALATAATTLAAADATATCTRKQKTRTRQSLVHAHAQSVASRVSPQTHRIHRASRVLRRARLESPRPSVHNRPIDRCYPYPAPSIIGPAPACRSHRSTTTTRPVASARWIRSDPCIFRPVRIHRARPRRRRRGDGWIDPSSVDPARVRVRARDRGSAPIARWMMRGCGATSTDARRNDARVRILVFPRVVARRGSSSSVVASSRRRVARAPSRSSRPSIRANHR